MNLYTLQQISAEHGVSVDALHQRRRTIALTGRELGRKIGPVLFFTKAEVRKLLHAPARGRPRKSK